MQSVCVCVCVCIGAYLYTRGGKTIPSRNSCPIESSNRHSFGNQVSVTGVVVTRQRLSTSKRPIDGCVGSAVSSRRLSNEVEEQTAPLNSGRWITAALHYADRDHRPGPF